MGPLLVLLLASSGAAAQSADELVDQGVELREQGRDAEAAELFARAVELDRSARPLAQLALAEQALGHWVRAEEHLVAALADRDDRWIASHRRILDEALAEIRSHIGELDVRSNVPGAELFLDGIAHGPLPLDRPARLAAGTVHMEVRAEAYYPLRRTVTIVAGELVRETAELAPPASGDDPRPVDDGEPGRAGPIVLLTVAGALGVTLIGGAVWWSGRREELQICEAASCRNMGELERTRTAAAAVTVTAGAGAIACLIAGIALLRRNEDGDDAVACAPTPGGLSCRLSF